MDSAFKAIREVISSLLARIRRVTVGGGDVSPLFRDLVRNGGFERPVIERDHWSRTFVPATDGWRQLDPKGFNHLRSDARGATGSKQFSWLAQYAITQDLDSTGLEGATLDVSLYIGGSITVSLGLSTHSWRDVDNPDLPGGWWDYVTFSHTVAPEDVPTLQLTIQGDSPKAFDETSGIEIVYDFVDNVSVRAWAGGAAASTPVYAQVPGARSPLVIRHAP
jgi:hypothetical protein